MQEIFLSKDLKKDVERIVGKSFSEITEEELKSINKLTLNKNNFQKDEKDYLLKDLMCFENLKIISLSGFRLIEEDIKVLNSLKKLNFVYFDFCNIYLNKLNFNENIEILVFNGCTDLKMSMLEDLKVKSLRIIGSKIEKDIIDINEINLTKNLQDLSINNYVINNINLLKQQAPSLMKLNLDGSIITDDLNLDHIEISHEKEFIRANAL